MDNVRLEAYLRRLERWLSLLPTEERAGEVAEVRAHLQHAIAAALPDAAEASATEAALAGFGPAWRVALGITVAWVRGKLRRWADTPVETIPLAAVVSLNAWNFAAVGRALELLLQTGAGVRYCGPGGGCTMSPLELTHDLPLVNHVSALLLIGAAFGFVRPRWGSRALLIAPLLLIGAVTIGHWWGIGTLADPSQFRSPHVLVRDAAALLPLGVVPALGAALSGAVVRRRRAAAR